jgi:hypothetical protein
MAKILENVTAVLLGIIDCYLFGYSKATYYVLPKKSFEPRYRYVD